MFLSSCKSTHSALRNYIAHENFLLHIELSSLNKTKVEIKPKLTLYNLRDKNY